MPNPDPYVAQELLSHQTFLRRLAVDLVGEDADDLVQDVWQRALERPPHHGRQLRSWLARVARNLAANRWRGEARRKSREELGASDQAAAGELEARFELRKELIAALDSLGEPNREAILLRYFEGLAPRQIAKRQGIPLATVKTRLRRGLAQLREALDQRSGGERATWMSAVTALVAPGGSGVPTGTLMVGGMIMGTMVKVSAGVLLVAAGMYLVTRTDRDEPTRLAADDAQPAQAADVEPTAPVLVSEVVSEAEGSATEAVRRNPVVKEAPEAAAPVRGSKLLRVILEGITEEGAKKASISVIGMGEGHSWPPVKAQDTWSSLGVTSEFDLDPFFARAAARLGNLGGDGFVVEVAHPLHFIERAQVPLSSGEVLADGQTVYEVRVPMTEVFYWPEFALNVRDANTRAHLKDVELRFVPTAFMGTWQQPGTHQIFTQFGDGMSSPIGMQGGRKQDASEQYVAGLAFSLPAGEPLQPAALYQPEETERGVLLYARAPGYAWGRIVLDVSKGADRELLLVPSADLNLRFSNVQLERYAALETRATLCVYRYDKDGDELRVWFQDLDETHELEGLPLKALTPGEYVVSVELGGAFSPRKRPVLARQELTLAAGDARELELVLADSPLPVERAPLAGVLSFPAFGLEEEVQLHFFLDNYEYGAPDLNLSLADMERVGGALPTWSFRLEEAPVGRYQVKLVPFMKNWMIEVPAGGLEDVEFLVPELAEVLIETVDERTGERIPLEELRYGLHEDLPGRVNFEWSTAVRTTTDFEGEPGLFRFWTAPGKAYVRTWRVPSGLDIGSRSLDLELEPGFQSQRFELGPSCTIHFEFRIDGAALPQEDAIFTGLGQGIRAIGHGGTAGAVKYWLYEATAPGLYEISFEGIGADRFLPIAPRRVEVRAGERTRVVVDLTRK